MPIECVICETSSLFGIPTPFPSECMEPHTMVPTATVRWIVATGIVVAPGAGLPLRDSNKSDVLDADVVDR